MSKAPNLKSLAKQMSSHINREFRDASAQVYNEKDAIQLTATKFLKMPDYINTAISMPGLPFGQIVQLYGKKDSGKSSFLQQTIVACQEQGVLPILFITEPKFDLDRLERYMGGDRNSLVIIKVDNLEDGFARLEKFLLSMQEGFITVEDKDGSERQIDVSGVDLFFLWDSIGGTMSTSELDYNIEDHDKDMGRFAKSLKSMVKRVWQRLSKVGDRAGILFLNQVWDSRTFTGIVTQKPYGGESVQHYYALEIHLKKKSGIEMTMDGTKTGIGYKIEFRVMKNHLTAIRKKTPMCVVASGIIPEAGLGEFKKKYLKELKQCVN